MVRLVLSMLLCTLVGCSDAPGKSNADPNNANNANNVNNEGGNACDAASPIPDGATTCRSSDDCADTETCAYDGFVGNSSDGADLAPCGPCGTVECTLDSDCVEGEICRIEPDSPSCCSEVENTRCAAPCQEGECAAGLRCEEDGQCRAIPCGEGYECPSSFVCDPARDVVDDHGCALGTCDLDGVDCPDDHVCDETSEWRDTRNCAPERCDEGFECGENQSCDAEAGGHGCVARRCDADGDCDCGACIGGVCSPRIHYCVQGVASTG